MAREFSNTNAAKNNDRIVYSGVPPIAGLATCSVVARVAFDSDCPSFGQIINISDAANFNTVSVGRYGANEELFHSFRNATFDLRTFPFSFDGTMRSVVCTFDGAASPKDVAYVNGVSQTLSGTALPNTTIGSGQTFCGVGWISNYGTNGRIAEVAVYNRVITQAEATMHANGMACTRFPRGLIFYAPLIREVHDIAGGLTGTITGTAVSSHPRIFL